MNEILMMDYNPLLPLVGATAPVEHEAGDRSQIVARLRYQLTKVTRSDTAPTIPVVDPSVSATHRA